MVDALRLLESSGSHHDNVNAALARVADRILASVDATCGTAADSVGASAWPECAPPPSQAATARIAAAAATAQPPSPQPDASRVVILRGADGKLSVPMPLVGLGTWLTTGAECEQLVAAGLAAGLRAIDGSENYLNLDAIGRAVEESKIPRGELFLASKLSHAASYSKSGARAVLTAQLEAMRTSYLDLFMLHSVGPSVAAMHESWVEMKMMQREGLGRSIGVSNFQIHDLDNLLSFDNTAGGPPYEDSAQPGGVLTMIQLGGTPTTIPPGRTATAIPRRGGTSTIPRGRPPTPIPPGGTPTPIPPEGPPRSPCSKISSALITPARCTPGGRIMRSTAGTRASRWLLTVRSTLGRLRYRRCTWCLLLMSRSH